LKRGLGTGYGSGDFWGVFLSEGRVWDDGVEAGGSATGRRGGSGGENGESEIRGEDAAILPLIIFKRELGVSPIAEMAEWGKKDRWKDEGFQPLSTLR